MPENARVFLVDDMPDLREGYKGWLEAAGHQVVLEATTLQEALTKVGELETHQVNVAILDGNLSENAKSGNHGADISEAIRERFPHVKIMGLSHGHYTWADVMFSKSNVYAKDGSNPLGEAVNKL